MDREDALELSAVGPPDSARELGRWFGEFPERRRLWRDEKQLPPRGGREPRSALGHRAYNSRLALAGVIVNRVERTVAHRAGQAEIARYFGPELVWSPRLLKRTVLQEGARRGVPLTELRSRAAHELGDGFGKLAGRIELAA